MAQVTSENARPASVTAADITSNSSSDSVSLVNGLVRLQYFESILQDSIKATVIYSDAGDSINGQSVIEGLPLVGTEDFELAFTDNNDVRIKVNLNVNEITPFYEDANKTMTSLNLVSEVEKHNATDVVFVDDIPLEKIFPEPAKTLDKKNVGSYLRVTAATALIGLREVREISGMPYVALRSKSLRPHQMRLKRLIELIVVLIFSSC